MEITALLAMYLKEGALKVNKTGRGYAWLDTGTHGCLLDAGNFVRTLENRQGLQVGSPDEIAHQQGWINRGQLEEHATKFQKNDYGQNLERLLENKQVICPQAQGQLTYMQEANLSARQKIYRVIINDVNKNPGQAERPAAKILHTKIPIQRRERNLPSDNRHFKVYLPDQLGGFRELPVKSLSEPRPKCE